MKKLSLAVIGLLLFSCAKGDNYKDRLQGTWSNGKVEYTFENDTLFIDEIGIEGDTYTYAIERNKGNTFTIKAIQTIDVLPNVDTFEIKVISMNTQAMNVNVLGEKYIFNKLP